MLTKIIVYGRPGFGEDPKHDQKFIVAVLKLDDAICLKTMPDDDVNVSENNICEIGVWFKVPWKHRIGHHITLEGVLFHAVLASHFRTIMMDQAQFH